LTYIHKPEEFIEQKSLANLLSGLDKDALVALITRLVERDPDLYDRLGNFHPCDPNQRTDQIGKLQRETPDAGFGTGLSQAGVLHLETGQYENNDDYDWEGEPAYIEKLEEVLETAVKFLDANDAEGALIILRVLLEEITNEYEGMYDESGDLACVLQDIGMPMAEAILSADLNAEAHKEMEEAVQGVFNNLDESIEESELEIILAALEHGWGRTSR